MKLLTILKKVLHLGLRDEVGTDWKAADADLLKETPESIAARRAALGLKDVVPELGEVKTPFSVVRAVIQQKELAPVGGTTDDTESTDKGAAEKRELDALVRTFPWKDELVEKQGSGLLVGLPRGPVAPEPMPVDYLEMPKETLVRVIQMERMRTREAKAALASVGMPVAEEFEQTRSAAERAAGNGTKDREDEMQVLTKQRDEAERLLEFAHEGWEKAKKDEAGALASALKCVANLKQARQAYVELAVECMGLTEENEALRGKLKEFEHKATKGRKTGALKNSAGDSSTALKKAGALKKAKAA